MCPSTSFTTENAYNLKCYQREFPYPQVVNNKFQVSVWGKQASCIKRTEILTQVHAGKTLMIPRYWHPQKSIMTFDQKKSAYF